MGTLPKGLYGAELWNCLSSSQEETLERAHRFCIKLIQGLPKQTRSVIALGLIGSNPIISEIDRKKFIFLGQLCRLPPGVIQKQLFNHRLFSVFHASDVQYGFIPDILRILDKYSFQVMYWMNILVKTENEKRRFVMKVQAFCEERSLR